MFDEEDDPGAPPGAEELERAAALRRELEAEEPHPEAAWLAAHLRYPREDDALGELPGRGLARHAREALAARRVLDETRRQRRSAWRGAARGLYGTGGLVALAALLLVVSSLLLDQNWGAVGGRAGRDAVQAALMRASLQAKESPAQRVDLMIEERLQALRGRGYRAGRAGHGVLAVGGGVP